MQNKMQTWKKLILSLCFVAVFSMAFHTVSSIFERKDSREHFNKFWEDPGEYDVWFMGTSHIRYSMQPLELWREYGIRSYNLAAPSSYLSQTYWTLMCALEYSQPQVIVLDTYKVQRDVKNTEGKLIHTGFDEIPLSVEKVKAICDLFSTWDNRFEYLCDFSIYHNRWENLGRHDFYVEPSVTNGGKFKDRIVDKTDFKIIPKDEKSGTDTVSFSYLKKIIEECKKRDIQLILTNVPFCSNKKMQRAINAVPDLAKEHGVMFMDLTYEEQIVDFGVDFGDKAHVNLFGGKKLTDYVGNYLLENSDVQDYRQVEEVAEKWNRDLAKYDEMRLKELRKSDLLKRYVQWLYDDRYTCYMYQKEEPTGILAREFAQLENITEISRKEAEDRLGAELAGEYAFFVEDSEGNVLDIAVFQDGKRL